MNPAAAQKMSKRKRLVAKLDQVNQEFENLVQEQISELTRLNFELEVEMIQHKRTKEFTRASEEWFRNMANNTMQYNFILMRENLRLSLLWSLGMGYSRV